MAEEFNNFISSIRNLIAEETKKIRPLGIYQVTSINSERDDGFITEYKCSIKSLTWTVQYNDVPMLSLSSGNLKGIMKYPEVDDLVLVGFLGDSPTPIILGTLYDTFTQSPDTIPLIKRNELFLNNRMAGGYIYINKDNEITLKTGNSATNEYAKLKLYKDGSFKMFNKSNYGIECDKDGNLTLRGVTITQLNTAGTWN